jgi:hypothetical protein
MAGTRGPRPPVEDHRPPPAVLRVVNPIMRTLLRSPLHRPLSRRLMVLQVEGRRTHRTRSVVVGRHEDDGVFLVSASGAWRHNLQGGAPVGITLDGTQRTGYAELEEDPDQVAQIFCLLLERLGLKGAGILGLRVNLDRLPTPDELRPAVARRAVARVHLDQSLPAEAERSGLPRRR